MGKLFGWLNRSYAETIEAYNTRMNRLPELHAGYVFFDWVNYDIAARSFSVYIEWNGELNQKLQDAMPQGGYAFRCSEEQAACFTRDHNGSPVYVKLHAKCGRLYVKRLYFNSADRQYELFFNGCDVIPPEMVCFWGRGPVDKLDYSSFLSQEPERETGCGPENLRNGSYRRLQSSYHSSFRGSRRALRGSYLVGSYRSLFGSYWSGSYRSLFGSYWSGSYRSLFGSYWSGSYRSLFGSYWSGSYRSLFGSYWSGSYRSLSGSYRRLWSSFLGMGSGYRGLLGSYRNLYGSYRGMGGSYRVLAGSQSILAGSRRRLSGSYRRITEGDIWNGRVAAPVDGAAGMLNESVGAVYYDENETSVHIWEDDNMVDGTLGYGLDLIW